jgi:hypothetical protein
MKKLIVLLVLISVSCTSLPESVQNVIPQRQWLVEKQVHTDQAGNVIAYLFHLCYEQDCMEQVTPKFERWEVFEDTWNRYNVGDQCEIPRNPKRPTFMNCYHTAPTPTPITLWEDV